MWRIWGNKTRRYWLRMRRAERRRRKECARPGVNVATLNIEPYSLLMQRLVVVGVAKTMERNGEKKCDEKIEPSMAPFWGWRYLLSWIFLQHSHHLSLCAFHHWRPTVLFPVSRLHIGISEVYVSVSRCWLVQNFTIRGLSTQSYAFFIPLA